MLLVCYWIATGLLLAASTGPSLCRQVAPGSSAWPQPGSLHLFPRLPQLLQVLPPRSLLLSHCLCNSLQQGRPLQASSLSSKVALADSVKDPLEASPLSSTVTLADSVEDPLEASPLCSKVALADSVEKITKAFQRTPQVGDRCASKNRNTLRNKDPRTPRF